ncbi:MAG: AroM family protein [Vicinamibacterales bacterium]
MSLTPPASRSRLGIVTIGQAPRPDLVEAFGAAAGDAEIRVAGALDGVATADLAALTVPGSYPLLVRLADGTTIEVPRDRLVPRVEVAASVLAADGARVVVVACAGEFPPVPCTVPVLLPGRLVPAAIGALAAGRRVGVVTPNAAQVRWAEAKWRADGFDVVVTHAAPGRRDAIAAAGDALLGHDLRLVVLDCMGHAEAERAELETRCGVPVVAVQTLVARLAAAML